MSELRDRIESEIGIPGSLLTGETDEDIMVKARAILAFRREQMEAQEVAPPKDTRESFSRFLNENYGSGEATPGISDEARLEAINDEIHKIPRVRDGSTEHLISRSEYDGFTKEEKLLMYMRNCGVSISQRHLF